MRKFEEGDRVVLIDAPSYTGVVVSTQQVVSSPRHQAGEVIMVKVRWDSNISIDFGEWIQPQMLEYEVEKIRNDKLNQLGI